MIGYSPGFLGKRFAQLFHGGDNSFRRWVIFILLAAGLLVVFASISIAIMMTKV